MESIGSLHVVDMYIFYSAFRLSKIWDHYIKVYISLIEKQKGEMITCDQLDCLYWVKILTSLCQLKITMAFKGIASTSMMQSCSLIMLFQLREGLFLLNKLRFYMGRNRKDAVKWDLWLSKREYKSMKYVMPWNS